MSSISISHKIIANYLHRVIGPSPEVNRYQHEEQFVDIFSCKEKSEETKLTAFATIGLSDIVDNPPLEILAVTHQSFDKMPHVLSSCAFAVQSKKWKAFPGAVFTNMINIYYPDSAIKHLLFSIPYLWLDSLKPLAINENTVHWLLGTPISDEELLYKINHGDKKLLTKFVEDDANLFDLNRKSVV